MNEGRAHSSPNLPSAATSTFQQPYDDSALEGIAANIKLVLKLIQDHKDACSKGKNDSRRMLRVATMVTILDNARTRIQKCQSFGNKRSEAALRRCNTDLRLNHPPKDKKAEAVVVVDEKEKLRRELAACMAAKKSLEMMCSSLGKEKEIMAKELSRKVHALNEMEDIVNDLRAQNEDLVRRLQKRGEGRSDQTEAMQERIKNLSELLLRSNDGCRMMKKRLEEAEEESTTLSSTIGGMAAEVEASLERVKRFGNPGVDVQDEILALESMLRKMHSLLK